MKKIICLALTIVMLFSITSAAFAAPKANKSGKPETQTVEPAAKNVKAPDKALDNAKNALIRKCDEVIAQLGKLKDYIDPAKLNIDANDTIIVTAKTSIDNAITQVNTYKTNIAAATSTKELKTLQKQLQSFWTKNQNFVKRVTGLTSTARLNTAYNEAKALVEKLKAGVNAISADAAGKLNKAELQEKLTKIEAKLEEANKSYLEAVKLYSAFTIFSSKADRNFKEAHGMLMEAKDGIHDALMDTKQLLVKIKNMNKPADNDSTVLQSKVEEDDDDDDDDEEDEEDEEEQD